jgi:hypothetical protein
LERKRRHETRRSPRPGEREDLRKRVARALEDELSLIERRHRFELGRAEIRMMRSRAETVQREAQKRAAAKAANGAFRKSKLARVHEAAPQEAEQHLVLIDRVSPDPARVMAEEAALAKRQYQLATERSTIVAEIRAAAERVPAPSAQGIRRVGPTVVVINPSLSSRDAAPLTMSHYDRLEVDRLLAWLKKAGAEADRYEFGAAELSLRAPKAVCTRLIKHWGRPEVMTSLGSCIAVARSLSEAQRAPHVAHTKAGTAQLDERRPATDHTSASGDKHIGQERLRQLSRGPATSANQRQATQSAQPAHPAGQKSASAARSTSAAAVQNLRVSAAAAPADQTSFTPTGSQASKASSSPAAPLPTPQPERSTQPSSPPEYIRLDAEFIAAERAAGRSVESHDLSFWRKVMTAEEPLVLTAPLGGTQGLQIIVDDEPASIEVVSRRLERTANDPQLSRYLRTMVPTLSPVRPGELGLASIPVTLHASLTPEQDVSAEVQYGAWRSGRWGR